MARDYPPLPGVFDVPWHLINPWATAQTHIWLILLYLDGLDGYIHAPGLTTGEDVYEISDHDAETCAICGPTVGPLFPQQPRPSCTCRYAVQPVRDVVGTIPLDLYGIGKRYGVWCFTIDPWCPHHGIPGAYEGRQQAYREMEAEEAEYWVTLDEFERRGL